MESPSPETALFAFLDELGIDHETHRHAPVFTVEEAQAARHALPAGGGHSKNLFVRDKKKNYALVVAEETRPIDLKALAPAIGLSRISFASAERLRSYLGVEPGSVTPFALLHAHRAPAPDQPPIRVILDAAFMAHSEIYFHPLHNAATTSISPDGLTRFIRACGFEPAIMAL